MSRRRRHAAPWLSMAIPAAALAGWASLGDALGAAGLGLMMAPAVVLTIAAPGLTMSFTALPQLLIPDRWRIEWRRDQPRPAIPARLRRACLAADRYRCAWCSSYEDLQVDHVKPWSCGGLSALWNVMTLCGPCNRVKSNCWYRKDGSVIYRPFKGGSMATATAILDFELRHRWRPDRWIRAGWSLAR